MSRLNTIGIIAPASACPEEEIENYRYGIKFLEDLGFKVVLAKNIFDQVIVQEKNNPLGTAGSIETRVEEFHRIWSDLSVDLVLSARGGYGCIQLLDQLDYGYIKKHPKPLLGYSDLTALFMALYHKCGLQTFHSPMLSEIHKWHDTSKEGFLDLLDQIAKNNAHNGVQFTQLKLWRSAPYINTSKIRILGGNLSIICSLIGTKYLPDFKNSVLLLEECNEPAYKIDRMLQQMKLGGLFHKVKSIWAGAPQNADFPYDTLESIASDNNIPLIKDLPIGHGEVNIAVPIG